MKTTTISDSREFKKGLKWEKSRPLSARLPVSPYTSQSIYLSLCEIDICMHQPISLSIFKSELPTVSRRHTNCEYIDALLLCLVKQFVSLLCKSWFKLVGQLKRNKYLKREGILIKLVEYNSSLDARENADIK